jgi:hypothetical protein
LLAGGCRRTEIVAGVTDSSFVAVMTDLRRIRSDSSMDSTRRTAARARALQGRGLTVDQLEAAARALASDPKRAVTIWREIDRRVTAPPTIPKPPSVDSLNRDRE